MTTFYVLFDTFTHMFVRAGKGRAMTMSLNAAKHFTSEWSANKFKANSDEFSNITVKKIQRY